MGDKKRILIIMGRYLPGYKDGGPVRSIINLTDYLGNEYNFYILTCDRDHGDTEPYPNIKVNDWNQVRKAKVYYVPPKGFTFKTIKRLTTDVDLVYVCGCFNDYAINTLILNRLGQINKPVVVASMGLFMPNAMKKKPLKYNAFITLFRVLGMFKKISWSTTSTFEAECTKNVISMKAVCHVAEDLPRIVLPEKIKKEKVVGELRVFFISRISPEKNLHQSIEVLKLCKSNIHFTIYGPIHDEEYWNKIQNQMRELPSNIYVEYKGNVNSERVVETLKKEHVFLFMTIGENFSHVIQEALSSGCPCVISDQTPWKDLEQNGVGYVLPLKVNKIYAETLDMYAKMTAEEFQRVSEKAHEYAMRVSNDKAVSTGYREIFAL